MHRCREDFKRSGANQGRKVAKKEDVPSKSQMDLARYGRMEVNVL